MLPNYLQLYFIVLYLFNVTWTYQGLYLTRRMCLTQFSFMYFGLRFQYTHAHTHTQETHLYLQIYRIYWDTKERMLGDSLDKLSSRKSGKVLQSHWMTVLWENGMISLSVLLISLLGIQVEQRKQWNLVFCLFLKAWICKRIMC